MPCVAIWLPWFQSTPPTQGATYYSSKSALCQEFQSTPPTQGATVRVFHFLGRDTVSIHAPHAGGDGDWDSFIGQVFTVSIHAPHAGGDVGQAIGHIAKMSVSIHAPHAGGDAELFQRQKRIRVSIHAPHAGGDRIDY